jgi:hypothetical protein
MDNNFYKILESFKRVTEGGMKDMLWDLSDRMDREQFIEYTTSEMGFDADEMAEFWDGIHGPLDETFTGYWKGTDAGTPGKKMVGADESIEPTKINTDGSWQQEGPWVKSTGKDPRGQVTHASDEAQRTTSSLEDRLRSQWEKTKREKGLQEYGMTTGGTQNPGAQDQADPAAVAKQTAAVQQGVNKLKSAGVNIPSGSQAVQSLMKDPTTDPVSQLDKTVDAGLGQEVQNIVTKGQPNDVNQLAALIRKVNQSSGV